MGGHTAEIPDDELIVIVDLVPENGAWAGSIIIPGLGLKGAPLTDIMVKSPDVNFAIKGPLGVQMKLRLDANGKTTGNLEQARKPRSDDVAEDRTAAGGISGAEHSSGEGTRRRMER